MGLTRREFLLASAGLVAGAACTGDRKAVNNQAPNLPLSVSGAFPQFDHLVVLMMENRTFDNMLGYLYQPNEVPRGQQFDGVAGKNLSNPGPNGPVYVSTGTIKSNAEMDNPNPDPGEEYPHLNTDLFGTVDPPSNALKGVPDMDPPFNAPNPIPDPAPMNGFVKDYINNFTYSQGRAPTEAEYSVIMNCWPPESVPVISALAKGFAVADHWHCEVPSQTFCNRSFFHAATSSGFTSNEPYYQFPLHNDAPTVFNRLDDENVPWRIYFDPQDYISMTALIHFRQLWTRFESNIRHMDQFLEDARSGTLPSYSFIEPRLIFNHNDEHPPSELIFGWVPESNVLAGEALIAQVYDAIRTSNSSTGSNWKNTALLITYDEGGGCYDHVSPPAAPPPIPSAPAGEEGFTFNRLGVRVPAVLVSAYTQPGTIVNAPLRHTAVIRTMSEKWGLKHLTDRDQQAPTLAPFFNSTTPRPAEEWPKVTPRPVPSGIDYNAQPLNELQKAFINTANVAVGTPLPAATNAETVGDAMTFLQQKFGKPR